MDEERKRFAASTSRNPLVADKLDQILGPDDRAFIVCTYLDCNHNAQGECMIYTVQDVPPMKPGAPCDRYEAPPAGGGETENKPAE